MTNLRNVKTGERISFAELMKLPASKLEAKAKGVKKGKNSSFDKNKPEYQEVWRSSNERRARLAFYIKKDFVLSKGRMTKETTESFHNSPSFGESLKLTAKAERGLTNRSKSLIVQSEKSHIEAVEIYREANKK